MSAVAEATLQCRDARPLLDRALETERTYFQLGAKVEHLAGGSTLAWTPGFVHVPAGSVVQLSATAADRGPAWLRQIETRLLDLGIGLARIYLQPSGSPVEAMLRDAGYADRQELVFAHDLPEPPALLSFRRVQTVADWARKRGLQEAASVSPDGHRNPAADMVGLEQHKCAHGMEAFIGEIDDKAVGAVCAIRGDGILRIKNLLVHPDFRRRSVATALLSEVAAMGRRRGIQRQCLMAIAGGAGEKLYRSLGMELVGRQAEWSKRLDQKD